MPKKSILVFTLLSLSALSFQLSADLYAGGAGTTGAAFLKVGTGARATGMGEAFVGISDDVTSIFWNPAGLNSVEKMAASFTYNAWLVDSSQSYIAYGQRINEQSVLGASFTYLGYGSLTRRDDLGNAGEAFSPSDISAAVAYARQIKNMNIGASVKFISETLDPADSANGSAMAIAFDAGAIYYPEKMPALNVGVAVQNIGTPLKFITEQAALPMVIKAGIGYKIISTESMDGTMAADLIIPLDNKIAVHAGMELWIQKMFAVRVGYKTDTMMDINPLAGLCAGVGVKWQTYNFDFAFVPYGDLGNTFRVSAGTVF